MYVSHVKIFCFFVYPRTTKKNKYVPFLVFSDVILCSLSIVVVCSTYYVQPSVAIIFAVLTVIVFTLSFGPIHKWHKLIFICWVPEQSEHPVNFNMYLVDWNAKF